MLEQVKKILLEYTDNIEITKASLLSADLGLTSFEVISIVTEFEDEFDIEIPDRDMGKFICVGDIVEYLKEHT